MRAATKLAGLVLAFSVVVDAAGPLAARGPQTNAVCASSFSWMDNSKSMSPCYVAAQVLGSCESGDWLVRALPQGSHYDAPNATTANLCTCSWAAYNLLEACTACQGLDASILTWSAYSVNSCAGKTANQYFPSNVTLPADAYVPYWAAVDPTQWTNARFDSSQAKALDDQGQSDLTQSAIASANNTKHKSNAGAIAGGVVGGLVGLAALIGIIFLLRRRRAAQRLRGKEAQQWDNNDNTHTIPFRGQRTHGRNTSAESTTKASFFGRPILGLRSMVSSPVDSRSTPEPHQHQPHRLPSNSLDRAEDVITPFSLTTRTPPGLVTPASSKDSHGYFDEHGMRILSPDGGGSSSLLRHPDSVTVVSAGGGGGGDANHSFENAFPGTAPNPPAYTPVGGGGGGQHHAHSGSITSIQSGPPAMGHRKGQTSLESLDSLGSGFANVQAVDRMSTVPEASSEGFQSGGTYVGTGMTTAMMQVIREHDRPNEHRDGEVDLPDIA